MDEQIQPQSRRFDRDPDTQSSGQPINQDFQLSPSQGEPLQPSQPNKKLWIYVLVGLIIAGGAFGFYVWQKGGLIPTHIPSPVACTKDALRCSDGTVVGRTGSNCEFVCPPDLTADWQTYRNEEYGFEFRYPDNAYVESSESDSPLVYLGEALILSLLITDKVKDAASIQRVTSNGLKEYGLVDGRQAFSYCMPATCEYEDGSLVIFDSPITGKVLFIDYNPNHEVARQVLSTFRFIEPEPTICVQVITPARNLATGEVRDFPTPCDVPEGWEKI